MSSQAPANVGLSVDNELYYAVVEQVRSWLVEDGPLIQEIKRKAGKLDGRTLRRIAMSYAVNRGIGKKGKDGDTHAEGFARLLNNQSPWPSDLIERANRCAEVVRERHRERVIRKSLRLLRSRSFPGLRSRRAGQFLTVLKHGRWALGERRPTFGCSISTVGLSSVISPMSQRKSNRHSTFIV